MGGGKMHMDIFNRRLSDKAYGVVYGALILGILIICSLIIPSARPQLPDPLVSATISPLPTPSAEQPENDIYVYIVGQVVTPGVYQVPYGSLVEYVIRACGGFLPDADISSVNLVYTLTENCMINVGSGSAADSGIVSGSVLYPGDTTDDVEKVNINTASEEMLCTLPGIGPATAAAIIKYREKQPFTTIEDIMNVNGIGQAKFDSISEFICIE